MKKNTLKTANIVLLFCAAVCLVSYDIFGGLWLKGVTSSWFVLLGAVNLLAARQLPRKMMRVFLLIECGLLFGMCADVLLGVVFFAGVGVFALGHILYLAAFCCLEKFRVRDLIFSLPSAVVSIFMILGTPWIRVEDPVMRLVVLLYALIISAMLGKAISNLVSSPSRFCWLLAIGSVRFWFSDLMLLIDMFGTPSRLTWILCSYTYWPAQNLLAHALYHGNRGQDNT